MIKTIVYKKKIHVLKKPIFNNYICNPQLKIYSHKK